MHFGTQTWWTAGLALELLRPGRLRPHSTRCTSSPQRITLDSSESSDSDCSDKGITPSNLQSNPEPGNRTSKHKSSTGLRSGTLRGQGTPGSAAAQRNTTNTNSPLPKTPIRSCTPRGRRAILGESSDSDDLPQVHRRHDSDSMSSGSDSDTCTSSTFELGHSINPPEFLKDCELSVCASGKVMNRTRIMDVVMARCCRRLRNMLIPWRGVGMCDAGLIDGIPWASANTNEQGGPGGVPLIDGSRKEYYANGGDKKPDWDRRPTIMA